MKSQNKQTLPRIENLQVTHLPTDETSVQLTFSAPEKINQQFKPLFICLDLSTSMKSFMGYDSLYNPQTRMMAAMNALDILMSKIDVENHSKVMIIGYNRKAVVLFDGFRTNAGFLRMLFEQNDRAISLL